MGLDVSIKSCCKNPMDVLYLTSHPIEIKLGSDGWPIINFIQDELKHKFNGNLDIVHLNYSELLSLVIHLLNTEPDDKNKFVGSGGWFKLGIMVACCQGCGVDVFASW